MSRYFRSKKLLFTVAISTLVLTGVSGQEKGVPITIAYWGHYTIQPGFRLGTELTYKQWEVIKERKGAPISIWKSFYLRPQIGFYTRPTVHNNFLVNAEIGYKKQKRLKKNYSSFSLGIGFLRRYQILSHTVDLGSGETTDKDREAYNYFMPTVNYELGRTINTKFGWFTKFTIGTMISAEEESSTVFFQELGLKYYLNKKL